MPWPRRFFQDAALARLRAEERTEARRVVPYFDGLLAGDVDALVMAFSDEPELHDPVRGRVKGEKAFRRFVTDTSASLRRGNATTEPVGLIVTGPRTIEEVLLRFDRDDGQRVELPMAIATDRESDGRLRELRIYFSTWPLSGGHAIRPPLLQPDPDVTESDVVGEYQRALAAGDIEAAVATFEPDGYVREPAGGEYVHRGTDGLRAMYTLFFSNGGGIPLEHCTSTDDGTACALEYNVVRWGTTPMPPEAGIAVYVRGPSGRISAARIYDDSDPPLHEA